MILQKMQLASVLVAILKSARVGAKAKILGKIDASFKKSKCGVVGGTEGGDESGSG